MRRTPDLARAAPKAPGCPSRWGAWHRLEPKGKGVRGTREGGSRESGIRRRARRPAHTRDKERNGPGPSQAAGLHPAKETPSPLLSMRAIQDRVWRRGNRAAQAKRGPEKMAASCHPGQRARFLEGMSTAPLPGSMKLSAPPHPGAEWVGEAGLVGGPNPCLSPALLTIGPVRWQKGEEGREPGEGQAAGRKCPSRGGACMCTRRLSAARSSCPRSAVRRPGPGEGSVPMSQKREGSGCKRVRPGGPAAPCAAAASRLCAVPRM